MISKTKIKRRAANKQNPAMKELVDALKKGNKFWTEVSYHLTKPSRQRASVSLGKLNEMTKDGEIVQQTDQKITSRWWNPCPTLDACNKLGLDTREICKKAYHKPVQELLRQVHPGLLFERNYACIRPNTPFCEEIIYLEV